VGQGDGRHCIADRREESTGCRALRAPLPGGENHGHGPRFGPRPGRNVEYLLSLAIALDGYPRIHALAGDTDGVDGQEEIARRSYRSGHDRTRRGAQRISPQGTCSRTTMAHTLFHRSRRLDHHRPDTHTNVNDFRAILIEGRRSLLPARRVRA